MKTELIDLSPTRKQLVFEVPADVVEGEIERITQVVGRAAKVPGFRPGKAPSRIVRQRYREQILHDVMHHLIPRVVEDALRERAIEPVETPSIEGVSLEEGQPLTFTAAFETVPPLDPIDLDGVSVRRRVAAVTDDAVAGTIERLRDRHARSEPVEGRPVRLDDIVVGDLTRRMIPEGGAGADAPPPAPERHENVSIQVGSTANPPGFDEALVGLSPGETKIFEVTFPADYPVADLAGQRVEYTVDVKGIRHKVLPDLDDEFAKDLGDFDSLAALQERVRQDLARDAERREMREMREDLLKQLAARVTVDVPDGLVEKEIDRRLEELVGKLMEQQIDPTKAGVDWNAFREGERETARDTVKAVLALDDLARREHVTVSADDVEGEIARLAARTGHTPDVVRTRLSKEGGMSRLRAGLVREKTLAHVLSRVTIDEQ